MPSNGPVQSNNKLGPAPGNQRANRRSWEQKEKEARRRGIGDWAERLRPETSRPKLRGDGRGDGVEASRGHGVEFEQYVSQGQDKTQTEYPGAEKSEHKKVR